MKILYRISDGGNSKTKPNYVYDKKRMFLHFINTFKNNYIYIFADNVSEDTYQFLVNNSNPNSSSVIRTSLGNSKSFMYCLDFAIEKFSGDEKIYFAEDDYIYTKSAPQIIEEGLDIADYSSGYDHPDKYINHNEGGPNPFIEKGGELTRVLLSKNTHWKLTNSCCMTFATRVNTVKNDYDIFNKNCNGDNPGDFAIFCELVKTKNRKLVSCIPAVSTHGEVQWLSKFVNWDKEFNESSFKKIIRRRNGTNQNDNKERKIPYIIHQTFKTNNVPNDMYNAASSYINLNKNYDYNFYDDDDIENIINEYDCSAFPFTNDELRSAYNKMNTGAGKADLFRYAIVYKYGGCYFDIDTVCASPLDTFITEEDEVVSGLGGRGDLHQWGLIYSKEHPFIKKTLENCVFHILNETYVPGFEKSLEGISGPPCLDISIKQVLNLPYDFRFSQGIHNINGFRINVLNGDLFGNNIEFKYHNYLNNLQEMNVEHWGNKPIFK